jgi:hypothetical protein
MQESMEDSEEEEGGGGGGGGGEEDRHVLPTNQWLSAAYAVELRGAAAVGMREGLQLLDIL